MSYYIGLDIGTSSVGWAVINNKTELERFKRQSMWGVRKFDEAQTASKRRDHRSARRRLKRRKVRTENLQVLMDPLIQKVDAGFFHRLEESYRYDSKYLYNLFVDERFTDKDYYDTFPTIYHLRKHLMETDEKIDIRLVYLALHHIVKYRGHFLFEGQELSIDDEDVVKDILSSYVEEDVSFVVKLLQNKKLKPSQKRTKIKNILGEEYHQFASAILGLKINLEKLFDRKEEAFSKNRSITEIFDDENNDDVLKSITDEELSFLEDCYKVYSWLQLQDVLKGYPSISQAKVALYDDHAKDLADTKYLLKKYDREAFKSFFKGTESSYEKYRQKGHQNQSNVNNNLRKKLKSLEVVVEDQPILDRLVERTENKIAFPLQKSLDNAAIPYQIHYHEAEQILNKQSKHYPYLRKIQSKVLSIISFRIPYYVGPLDDRSAYTSVSRKSYERVYPWNFQEVIDLEKSSEQFIDNLTSFCTYIPNEKVLPKNSIYYQYYELYNELNGIRIDGEKIGRDLKKDLINNLFLNKKTVTDRDFRQFLIERGYYLESDYPEIKGYQKEKAFSTSLSSAVDFSKIFDSWEEKIEDIEQIILWLTIFKDKKLLASRLKREMPGLDSNQLEQILKLNYDGWGRFSRKLLLGIYSEDQYGSPINILDVMKQESLVFMQVLHHKNYSFKDKIDKIQQDFIKNRIDYEDVESLRTSPANKRGIWQSIRIVEEIVKLKKYEPSGIFIEMARSSKRKKRTRSRYETLKEIYQNDEELKDIHLELEKNQKALTREKVYLYFTQRGKCMYSGESLDLNRLSQYHVDHIIPRSVVKDDSLDNKVLVLSDENIRKSDSIFISPKIIHKMTSYWEQLLDKNLISPKKYFNLTRKASKEKEEEIIRGFIRRQLVETRQITQHVRNLLSAQYPKTDVIPIRSGVVTLYRETYDVPKSRLVNDFHHAHDAYLVASLGLFAKQRFPQIVLGSYHHKDYFKIPDRIKQNYVLHEMKKMITDRDTGEILWAGKESIQTMLKMLARNDVKITKQYYENQGEFYKETIYSADSGKKNLIPVNQYRQPVEKYGGYESLTISHLQLIEGVDRRNQDKKVIANIPLLYKNREEHLERYLKETYRLSKIKKYGRKIYLNQLINLNGHDVRVKSAREVNNATQLILPHYHVKTISQIEKKNFEVLESNSLEELYMEIQNKIVNYFPLYQNIAKKMKDQFSHFSDLDIEQKAIVIEKILIGIAPNAGRIKVNESEFKLGEIGRLSKNLNSKRNEIYLIDESITGLYARKTRIL